MKFSVLLICGGLLIGLQGSAQPAEVLQAEEIAKLLPNYIRGYSLDGEAKARLMVLGTIRYSLSEKNFVSGNRKIKVLLFDYKEASIMYNQATRKFSSFTPIETDSLILRSLTMTNCSGWESYNSHSKSSQILLGVCERFFLSIDGTNIPLQVLKQVVSKNIRFEDFPK
jgi:hypothetical protein